MRRNDWANRLVAYIEAIRRRPYDLVEHNCVLFAAGAVKAMCDKDPQREMGIEIGSARDVAKTLDDYDGPRGLATKYLGHEMKPRLLARRGDVVVRPGTDGDSLGICMGDHALFLTVDGLQDRPLADCDGCWSVE